MAANEFEKNVRKAMDGFRVHPSDEVWQKVEERIRENKRKRRTIFFIVFSFIALAVGGYGVYNFSQQSHPGTEDQARQRHQDVQPLNASAHKPAAKEDENTENIAPRKEAIQTNDNTGQVAANKKPFVREPATGTQKDTRANRSSQLARSGASEPGATVQESKTSGEQMTAKSDTNAKTVIATESLSVDQQLSTNAKNQKITLNEVNGEISKTAPGDTSLIQKQTKRNSLARKTPVRDESFKDWRWGFNLSLGASTITQDPFSFSSASYADIYAYSTPGTSSGSGSGLLYGPSSNKAGFAFKTGVQLKKGISPRSSLSGGLSYAYLSDRIKVGTSQVSAQSSGTSRSAYYTAAPQNSYTEHFHFVELPVIYDWRATQKSDHYFSLSGGASVSYLVSTNALIYDTSQHGTYYQDMSSLIRTHFNLLAGISYHFTTARNLELSTGPQFSFDMTKLMHSDVDKRKYFLYIGLDTRIFFERKKSK